MRALICSRSALAFAIVLVAACGGHIRSDGDAATDPLFIDSAASDHIVVVANTSLAARTFDVETGSWTGTASPSSFTLDPFAFRVVER